MAIKAIIVGRHTPDLGSQAENFEIVGNENIMFSLNRAEAVEQLEKLFATARGADAEVILLQNVPAILAAALLDEQSKAGGQLPFRMGLIISVPGPRQAGVVRKFELFSAWVARRAAEAILFANGRAKTNIEGATLTVTVDPVAEFNFDHIEWLS
jgi:hypothetical protein